MAIDNTKNAQVMPRQVPASGTVSQEDRAGAPTQSQLDDIAAVDIAAIVDSLNEESSIPIQEGDHLLLFSDGAVEVDNADGEMLGVDGLIGILKEQDYPTKDIQMGALEEELLRYSDGIRIEDDLTFIEIRFNHL